MTTSIVQYFKGWSHKITDGAAHVIIGTGTGITPDTLHDAATSTGASSSLALAAKDFTVDVGISDTANVKIEVSIDGGTTWRDLITGITSSQMYTASGPFSHVRTNIVTLGAGTVTTKVRQ